MAFECSDGLVLQGAKTIDFELLDRACEDAAHGEHTWLNVLTEVTGWVGGHKAMILDTSGASSYSTSLAFNHDPGGIRAYNSGYNRSDPRRTQSFSTPVGKVGLGQEFVRNEEIVRTAYFADICEAWDVRDSVHGVIADDEFGRLTISIQRGFDADYFDFDDGRRLEPILPILGRHLRTARRIASVNGGLNGADNVFGCLLLPDMTIANLVPTRPRLPAVIQERLYFAPDQVRFDCARMRTIFDKGVAVARAGQSTSCHLFETVFRFSPVPGQLDWMAKSDHAVLLTIGHQPQVDRVSPFILAHELTKRESDLLVQLVRGHDLRSAAAQADISYETARWHVKNMCNKAGYDRTASLIEAARSGDISRMS